MRDKDRFPKEKIYLLEVDLLKDKAEFDSIKDIDAAYFLIHSMGSNAKDFGRLEELSVK